MLSPPHGITGFTGITGITGTTRVFAILGDPIAQVRAPELFNMLFQRHGVDAVLVPLRVGAADVQSLAGALFTSPNFGGLWLTIPHKGALWPLLHHVDARGRVAQAVNAVRPHADGTLEGALFDGVGFVKALDHFGVRCEGARVLVVGMGGAGTAIAVSLAERGVAELALHGLDATAARAVAQRIARAWPALKVRVAESADTQGFDLAINATPLGLKRDDPLPFDPAAMAPGAAVVDILMKNQPTPLLQACAARGVRAFPGYQMMLQQATDYLEFFGLPQLAQAVREDPAELLALIEQSP